MSKIEWTEKTWNPVTGCSRASSGCANCYAEAISHRFGWTHLPWNKANAAENVVCHPERLDAPLKVKKPTVWFVNSMSDLFHEQVHRNFILQVFMVMRRAHWHTFQVLTKRPERMQRLLTEWLPGAEALTNMSLREQAPAPNVLLGVSVENQKAADQRIPLLLRTPAAVRFLSCEPLLEQVNVSFYADALDWVIAGSESGPSARDCKLDWLRSLRDQCQAAGVPYFCKQVTINGRKVSMPPLDGRVWDEMPRRAVEVTA